MLGLSVIVLAAEPVGEINLPAPTVAQMLGFGADEKLLIIHADDAGMCHSENQATIKGMEDGVINSASIMMPCPWVLEIADYCKKNPEADFGLHLTMNSEWKYFRWRPVADYAVPSLIDEEGYMWRDTLETASKASPEDVETELRAQVKRAYQLGIKPTHVDTHMGTLFARPDFFAAYRKVAREFDLPYLLPLITTEELEKMHPLQRVVIEQIRKRVVPEEITLDHLERGFPGGRPLSEQKPYYMDVIRKLKPGITQIILHCGMGDEEMKGVTGTHERRHGDMKVFTDPEIRELLKAEGVRLVTWREIGERQRKLLAKK
jgi:hypothetical protein